MAGGEGYQPTVVFELEIFGRMREAPRSPSTPSCSPLLDRSREAGDELYKMVKQKKRIDVMSYYKLAFDVPQYIMVKYERRGKIIYICKRKLR